MRQYFSVFRYKRGIHSLIQHDSKGVSIRELLNDGQFVNENVIELLREIFPNNPKVESEFKKGLLIYQDLLRNGNSNAPISWNAGSNLCSFLYTYVKIAKPQLVIETGIANGLTTLSILAGLKDSKGELHSFDIDSKTSTIGQVYPNWTWHKIAYSSPLKSFKKSLKNFKNVDLWIHDSDHSFFWQFNEYNLAQKTLSSDGILVSDDIDFSRAWSKFRKNFSKSYILLDKYKFIGIARFK